LVLTDLLFWVLWIASGLIVLSLIAEGLAGIGMLMALRSVRTASIQVTSELSKLSKTAHQLATVVQPQIKTLSNEMSGVVHNTIHQSRELTRAWQGYSATAERMIQKTRVGFASKRRGRRF
jgi:hypothetical protein